MLHFYAIASQPLRIRVFIQELLVNAKNVKSQKDATVMANHSSMLVVWLLFLLPVVVKGKFFIPF